HEKVWSKVLSGVNISEWMPGDNWDIKTNKYTTPPIAYSVDQQLTMDQNLADGEYIIALSVLDPAGMLPSLRFAVNNYFQGGRPPMGYVGVNKDVTTYEISSKEFTDMKNDKTLKYKLNK